MIERPIHVGLGEKASNNPPIEILIENEATLAYLPKTLPVGTVAYTKGRFQQWKLNASGAWEANGLDMVAPLLIAEEASGDDTQLTETWQKIMDAFVAGQAVILYDADSKTAFKVRACYLSSDNYTVEISAAGGEVDTYVASAATGKPVKQAAE